MILGVSSRSLPFPSRRALSPAPPPTPYQSLGDAVIVCIHSEPDTPRVLPRARVSPDTAAPPASFLSALKSPPFNLQSPLRPGAARELSAAAEAAVEAAREEGAPGLIPYVPEGLVEPLVEAFGVLSAADASDKRPRWGREGGGFDLRVCTCCYIVAAYLFFPPQHYCLLLVWCVERARSFCFAYIPKVLVAPTSWARRRRWLRSRPGRASRRRFCFVQRPTRGSVERARGVSTLRRRRHWWGYHNQYFVRCGGTHASALAVVPPCLYFFLT